MQDYKPNSHRFKEEQKTAQTQNTEEKKKVEKVVTGVVKTKKKSGLTKFIDIFMPEDVDDVKSYIFWDIVVPAGKEALSDIFDAFVWGGSRRNGKRRSLADSVSYKAYNKMGRSDRNSSDNSRTRTGYDYDDVVLETRGEAEAVLDRMQELIETYDMVSVADMYDLVGKTGEYTDHKYGWTNIRNAEPVRIRDGYILKLPKVAPLNIR